MANLLGFQITRNNQDSGKPADAKQAFTVASPDDGTTTISAGGYFGQYLDMEVNAKNDIDLSAGDNDTVETFTCAFVYQYFETDTTT